MCMAGSNRGRGRSSTGCLAWGNPQGHCSCASMQPSHPMGQAQGRGHAVLWQPCREIWAEMQLAKGEFTILHLSGLLQPFSEQWVTQENQ